MLQRKCPFVVMNNVGAGIFVEEQPTLDFRRNVSIVGAKNDVKTPKK